MIGVKISTKDLLRIGQVLEVRKNRINQACARMLNDIGDKTVDEVARMVQSQTLIPAENVRSTIAVKRATPGDLSYRVDASKAFAGLDDRQMGAGKNFKKRPEGYFYPGELVNIVTMDDKAVCEICQEAAEHGPYSIDEAQKMLPLHINCRCLVAAHQARRTLPVEFKKKGKAEINKVSLNQLVARLAKESKLTIRAN